jgi:hypothetical protein
MRSITNTLYDMDYFRNRPAEGGVKTLSDGTIYRVRHDGWRRMSPRANRGAKMYRSLERTKNKSWRQRVDSEEI